METIIILTPPEVDIKDFLKKIPDFYQIERLSSDRYLLTEETGHGWFERDDSLLEYFDDDEIDKVKSFVTDPISYCCEFSNLDFGKKILTYICNDSRFVIDNDHGDIMQGTEFVKKIKSLPKWDWRIKTQ